MPASEGGAAVDVVIPTRDTRDVTLGAVEAVVRSRGVDVSCIVVDNASGDGTADAIASRWPDVVVLRNTTNAGYARACNAGAAAGTAPLILFLNSDAMPREDAIRRIAEFLTTHDEHVAAMGKLVDVGTDRPQVGFAIRRFPSVGGQIAQLTGLHRVWPRNPIARRDLMLDFDFDRTQDVTGQPAGACLLVRRTTFEAAGGFDEGFFYWFEDVDIARRLAALGKVAYVHDAVFEHFGGRSFALWGRPQTIRTRYDSLLRYFAKHHSRADLNTIRVVVGVLAAIRAAVSWPVDRERARAYASVVAATAGRTTTTASRRSDSA